MQHGATIRSSSRLVQVESFSVLSRRWSTKMIHTCVRWSKRKLGWASEEVFFEVLSHKQGPRLKEASANFRARRDRFNELLEQGPNLGISGDLMLHTMRHEYPWVPTDQAHGRPQQVGPVYQKTHRPISGPNDLVDSPHDLLKTFQKIPQTT
jgi:hypothetical protein